MSRFADVTSDTPHGPRPVPEGHIPADDDLRPRDAPRPRHAPPRGRRVSMLVWGGLGLAGVIGALAARAAIGAARGNAEDRPRPHHAPRFAELDPEAQRAMRARAQADFHDYDEHAAELRAAALRKRPKRRRAPPRRPTARAGDGIGGAARNIAAVLTAANAALAGFREVSAHGDEIIRDFGDVAGKLREFLGARDDSGREGDDRKGTAPEPGPRQAAGPDDRRTHNL